MISEILFICVIIMILVCLFIYNKKKNQMNKEQKSRVKRELCGVSIYLIFLSFIPAFIEIAEGDFHIILIIIFSSISLLMVQILHLYNSYKKYKEKR